MSQTLLGCEHKPGAEVRCETKTISGLLVNKDHKAALPSLALIRGSDTSGRTHPPSRVVIDGFSVFWEAVTDGKGQPSPVSPFEDIMLGKIIINDQCSLVESGLLAYHVSKRATSSKGFSYCHHGLYRHLFP
jgi:hypothetical protein